MPPPARHLAVAAVALLAGLAGVLATVAPAAATGGSGPKPAAAAKFVVYTGYADCPLASSCYGHKITNPRFPSPWFGAKHVSFAADKGVVNVKLDDDPDTSAIRIDNAGTAPLTINKVSVKGCGSPLNLWGTAPLKYPYTVPRGGIEVFSSTSGNNFDGSEECGAHPTVSVTVDGVAHSYKDAIANSGAGAIAGGRYAPDDGDESTPWTKIAGGGVKIVVLPTTLRSATSGKAYAVALAVQDSNGAPSFTLTGSLPPGIRFKSKGQDASLAGTPTAKGTFHFKLAVSDTASLRDVGSRSFTLVVS